MYFYILLFSSLGIYFDVCCEGGQRTFLRAIFGRSKEQKRTVSLGGPDHRFLKDNSERQGARDQGARDYLVFLSLSRRIFLALRKKIKHVQKERDAWERQEDVMKLQGSESKRINPWAVTAGGSSDDGDPDWEPGVPVGIQLFGRLLPHSGPQLPHLFIRLGIKTINCASNSAGGVGLSELTAFLPAGAQKSTVHTARGEMHGGRTGVK